MAGQGITVSILAKIEGWLDLIKLIQNAMKNIKPGTDISKGLVKDLQLVNDMVNNLGKNMNQRLTSDSLITGFVDKIMLVEEVFNRLGTSMSHISFGDIKPEYITAGFKDLLLTLELANNALGQGMESSFQNAIANSKTLLKEFERMKIDPKDMNINAIQEALAERGKALEKDVNEGLKKLTDFEKGLEKLKNTRDELAARDKFLGKDANATVQSLLVGHQLPTKGTILDADELEKQVSFFRSNLLKAGFTPTQLNRIIPDLETVMKAGHWDEMPSKFAEYLREAQNRTQNSLAKASADYKLAILDRRVLIGDLNRLSALRFNNTLAQNEVSNILSGTVQNDTKSLRDIVSNLRLQLESAVTSGFKGLGSKLFSSSQQGMQDASAAMKDYSAALDQVKAKELAVNKVLGVVLRYFSIYAAVRMVSKGIRSMMTNIKDLDKTITEIAIVTKMNQNDLWGLMPLYTKLAKLYAASISGVYKVSQLYYQQGLGLQDVMALTEQTLKMARISGLDYAEATDYMTNAVRSFKMEMTDAATVVDVYSAVAASSASSVTELATAMSKTASSAAAVGSSFENTTAMLAVMIEATRESPENIGSAMKSIISRYGELKENKTGIDEEGEEYSLNKVDKALLTVGISIHDANGEFRDFDDVIFELSEKWNGIDKNTLRYIATVMAGNRQQSRFLALVSSAERLKEESAKAANSEDASQLQFLKTMDSIEAKTQLFLTSLLSLYTSSGLENLYKGLLDFGNEFANTLENISGKSGLVGAISNVGASFVNMATLATTGFGVIKTRLTSTKLLMETVAKNDVILNKIDQNQARIKELEEVPHTYLNNGKLEDTPEYTELKQLLSENTKLELERSNNNIYLSSMMKLLQKMAKILGLGMAASAAGMALSTWANTLDIDKDRTAKGWLTAGGSALLGLGTGMMVGASAGGPIGALVGILTALPGVLSGAGMLTETMAERILHLEKDITDTKNEKLKSKDELKTLEDYKKKYDELSKSLYESAEKKKEFMELSNSIAASYPELIKSMDAEGNYILNMAEGYERLAEAKRSAYQENLIDSIAAETAGLKDADYVLKNVYGQAPLQNKRAWHGLFDTSSIESLMDMDYKDFTEEKKNQVANLLTNRETANLVFSNLKDENGNLMDFYSFGPNLAANLSTVYLEFINKINENKDYSTAVSEILEQLGDSYTWLIEAFGTDVYKELKTRKDLPEYLEKLVDNATSAYNTELVNLLADLTEETFDITSNDILKRFAKELISKEFTEWKSGLDTETLTNPEKWQEAVKNFYNKYDAVWYKIEYESDLISGLSDDINDFYQDMGKHTKADIRKLFPEGELTDILQLLLKWLEDIFDLDFEDTFETYNNWLQEKDVAKFKVKDYSDKVGADYITQIQSQYKNIISNTGLSEKLITDQVAALNAITDFVTNLNLDFDTRNTLLTKYSAADFTSLNGIYNFVDTLSNLDIDLDLTSLIAKVQSLGDALAVNFEAEIDSYYDAIESSVSDFNKAVKSVTEGTDLKTAREIADKMGKSLSDFLVIDGKFYFDDIEALKKAYIKENDEYIADVLRNVNERYSTLESLSEVNFTDTLRNKLTIELKGTDLISGKLDLLTLKNTFSSADSKTGFLLATNITFTEFTKYYEEFLKAIDEGFEGNLLTFMLNKVQNTLDESGLAILLYLEQNTASSLIKSGNLKGFLQTIGKILTDELIEKQVALSTAEWQGELLNNYDTIVNDLMTLKRKSAKKEAYSYTSQMQSEFNKETTSGNQALYEQIYLLEKDTWSDIYLIREELEQIAKELAAAAGSADWKSYYKKLVAGKLVTKLAEFDRMVKDSTLREFDDQVANRTFDYEQVLQAKYSELVGLDDSTIRAEAEKEALKMMSVSDETWQKIVKKHPDFTILRLSEILSLDAKGVEALEESEKQILQDIRDSAAEEMINKIMSGDYSDLKDGNELFIGELYEYATSSAKTVMSSLTTALGGGENKIKITVGNKGLLEQLKASSIITNKELIIGGLAEIDVAALKNKSDNEFITLVNGLLADNKTKLEWIQSFLDVKYPNKVEQVTSLAGKEKTISRSDFQTYLDAFNKKNKDFESYAEDYGLAFNQYTNSWDIDDYDKYIQALKDDAQLLGEGTEARREADIAIDAADRQRKNKEAQDQVKAFEDVIKNYDHVTDDQMTTLQTALKDDWYLVELMLTPTGAGEYQLDIAKLRNNLDQLNLSDKVKESILQMFTSTADDYLKNISSATDLLTKGTTSLTDILDFKNKAKALGMEISDSAFHYDDILQAWTLDPAVLRSFILAQGQLLIDAGLLSLDEVTQYVNDNVTKTLVNAIDIKGFLEAEDKSGLARKKFAKLLSDAGIDSHGIDGIINTLIEGGSAAVGIMAAIAQLKGEELTSADIEQAYRAKIIEYENAAELLNYGVGSLVSGEAIQLLTDAGYTLASLGDDNNAVITQIGNISLAYANYYNAIKNRNDITLEALNNAKAKVLETQGERYKELTAIDALGEAAGMTYSSFAAILNTAGIEMTDDIIRDYTESLGGNKMRIKDFAAFARVMKWDYNSEEYTSGLKAYNDGLIERNTQVKDQITEELQGLKEFKSGDWLNLTYTEKLLKLYSKSGQSKINKALKELLKTEIDNLVTKRAESYDPDIFFKELQDALAEAGAYFDDGILKTVEGADLLSIFDILTTKIAEAAQDVDIDMDEIQGLLSEIIENYVNAIISGIRGGMSHSDKNNLVSLARNFGVELGDTDFYETADGLKLSTKAATNLYTQVSKVNTLKGKLIFDELNSSLKESDSRFKDITSIMSLIQLLTNEINELLALGDGGAADERVAAAERELALAKEIAAVRLTTRDDSSFSIKGKNTLSTSTHNALNYLGDVADIAEKAETWKTQGYIGQDDIEDFSDYVTHLIELGDQTGEGSRFYGAQFGGKGGITKSKLLSAISQAFMEVTDENGKSTLAFSGETFLKELGMDLGLGFEGFRLSESAIQGHMDTAGAFYKSYGGIFGAMDYLSKARKFGEFKEIEDLINGEGNWDLSGWKEDDPFKESLLSAAEHIKVGSKTLADVIKNNEAATPETKKAFQDLMTLAETTDWELESGYETIKEHMLRYGIEEEVDFGDFTYLMKGDNLLVKDNTTGKFVTADGLKFTDAKQALTYMSEQELAEYSKEFTAYSLSTDTATSEIEIPGTEYHIRAEEDHFILVDKHGNQVGTSTYDTADLALKGSRKEEISQLWLERDRLKRNPPKSGTLEEIQKYNTDMLAEESKILDEIASLQAMSDEGYSEWIKSGLRETGSWATGAKNGKNSYGQITSDVRTKLSEDGWTAESLANEAERLWKKSGLSLSQAAAEFKIKTGIDIDPETAEQEISNIKWQDYIDQSSMTLAAADVMSGITAAFTAPESALQISTTIGEGFRLAVVDLGGEDANKVKIPIEIDAELATTAIESIKPTEPVKIPFDGEIGDNIPPEVDPGEGTVNYTTGSVEKLPLLIGSGTVNYSVGNVEIPTDVVATGTINYKLGNVATPEGGDGGEAPKATGNVGLASGNARAGGTLMGELGPELVVSKGRYFVVGQSGPEMVNLADDAIVFNHLQTQSLLTKGTSSTRGKAITNEHNAVAFAAGSFNGGKALEGGLVADTSTVGSHYYLPVVNSIFDKGVSETLNSVSKNVALNTATAAEEAKNFIDKLERWYNWLQRIAHLEKEINIEEAKRTRYASDMIPHGKEYFTSQLASLEVLKEQLAVQKDLNAQRSKYFETLRKELNSGAFSILYEFDDTFLPKYKEGMYEFMRKLLEADWYKTGAPNNEAKAIYNRLAGMGFESMMQYDTSGNKINKEKEGWENQAVQAFVERYKKGLEEGQKYHDEILEGRLKVEELIDAENQILKEIEDNLISVENKVLKAIEDMRQQEIDNLKDEKDAIEKSANILIDGLNDQLDRERSLYQNQLNVDELNALQRRLGILLRSGGSASEIADLQAQIQEKQYDNYFDALELQIQAILDASDAEIQRLDNLITLMEETLAYLKEHGLLWADVNNVLKGTAQDIVDFISGNTTEYWSKSSTELQQVIRNDLFEVERFKLYLASVEGGMDALVAMYGENATESEHKTTSTTTDTTTDTINDLASQHSKAGTRRNYTSSSGYTGNPNYTGAADGSDLLYYQTEDGRIGIVRGKNRDSALYNLDLLEGEIGSKIIAVTSNFGDTPAALAALAIGIDLLTTSLFTELNGDLEKQLTADMQALTQAYMDSAKYQNDTWRLSGRWPGRGDKTVVLSEEDLKDALSKEDLIKIRSESNSTPYNPNINASLSALYNLKDTFTKIYNTKYVIDEAKNAVQTVLDTALSMFNKMFGKGKASGGYVGHGIYELGELGTETVLTAEQTQVLRNNILSNRPDSLISLLKSYNEAYHGLAKSTYDSISNTNTSNMVTIERAEVNLLIEKLADDYDSKRAANTIMDEMLRIASKTKANNSVRR